MEEPKFDGNSTYNTNYIKHPKSEIKNFAPNRDYVPCKGCADWHTTYNTTHDGRQNN